MTRISAALASSAVLFASFAYAQQPQSVYAPPEVPTEQDGTNLGAVHYDLSISYFTDYIYRGVEVFETPGAEDRLNLQLETKLSFDLGKLPHPFVSVFANISDNDPISDFQEIRPTVGFDWPIKPLVISAGHISYLYPDRDSYNTGEFFLRMSLDENLRVGGQPIIAPYAMATYDYDLYDGLYLEAGLQYKMVFEEVGLSLTFSGAISYVNGYTSQINDGDGGTLPGFFTNELTNDDTINGFQHWQVGLVGDYSLNKLFNVSNRYGDWSIRGYLFYTDALEDDIAATNQVWGGAGITFRY